ncbi:MAG: hypothetical protein CL607_09455 [Anaerolineaceae bacterium]|nr:hypothetical protein [Anaerolineaceae bacterium]
MSIANPNILLVLILALPLTWYIGWPRYAFRRRRDIASLLIRTVLLLLVMLAISGLQLVRAVEKQGVVFLVDVSDSVGTELQEAQLAYIQDAIAEKPSDDEWAIVVFGADVAPERAFNTLTEAPPELRSQVVTGNTNIAEAIQTAIAIFPADVRRRIIILSDGQETVGDAEAKARLAEAAGIEISYVPFFREQLADVRIIDLESPSRVIEGQEFDLSVSIESDAPTPARLSLYANGSLIHEEPIALAEGITRYTLTQTGPETGFLNFSARIDVADEAGFSQNNQLAAFTQVVGPPRVLLVASDNTETANLLPALQQAGLNVTVITPDRLPPETSALADYRSIVIANVPATDFTTRQMERLDSYVSELGGGLVFIGGPDSYGPGQYYDTVLEETLPVEMQIKDQQRLPQLTIAYLIDRSGSMAMADANGIQNIELAKRAIDISIGFLQPTDRAAIGTFDTGGAWVASFQDVRDQRQLQRLVATLRSGGGTDISAGLSLVERDIIREESERKHIILLTDGGSSPRDLVDRTRVLNEQYGVTMSVIALGSNPPPFLEEMAVAGEGNFHVVSDVGQIPNIFALETVLASRTFIEEGEFSAIQTASSPILDGISALPPYNGYVATTAKDRASVVLRGPEPNADPLLATWQYGLGRAVAFTSDATSRWASNWVTWDSFVRFWGQTVTWSITESAANNIETRVVMQDERARIVVDAQDDDGNFLNNLQLEASLLDPSNAGRTIRLEQVAPGRYEASFRPEEEGAYFLAITGEGRANGQSLVFNEVNGWVMSYSAEYAQPEPNETLLTRIADMTGGQSLADSSELAFVPSAEFRTAALPLWPWLLLLAAFLLPVDIAVRRLIITRSDVQRFRAWLDERRGFTPSDARMTTLMDVRQRARQQTGAGQEDDTVSRLRRRREEQMAQDERPTPQAPEPKKMTTAEWWQTSPFNLPPEPGESDEENTVSNLLKSRRRPRPDDEPENEN